MNMPDCNVDEKIAQRTKCTPAIGIRTKLIGIFLLVQIFPLILLAYIAWHTMAAVGNATRDTAVADSRNALTDMAVENIERITTDTAQRIATFLYHRDVDLTNLAQFCRHFQLDDPDVALHRIEEFFANFSENKLGLIRRHGEWKIGDDGISWVQVNPYIQPVETGSRSVNPENDVAFGSATFRYRPPYGFGDIPEHFDQVPFYDEIALLDKNGQQLVKYVTPHSTKTRFPFPKELLDVSDPKNTFVKAERYFDELPNLGKTDIYVSDVIGAYVPSRFIGMYTPDNVAAVHKTFHPEAEAYAGAENPKGIRFEGIIRWVKPVLDADDEVQGYVTFALNHDHLLSKVQHITPMPQRYTELSDASEGNYAFIWDYNGRSIAHPRHHSIVGYNPETGKPETPWLEQTLYDEMIASGFDRADWQDYIATLYDYVPWTGDSNSLAYQSRSKELSAELETLGFVGLDGRFLNNAPQCTGWMNLTEDGGSGSFYIKWSGLDKLTTAAAIPYYTGQYSPEVRGNYRGFGFVTIGAGVDDFNKPAQILGDTLEKMIDDNILDTAFLLFWATVALSIIAFSVAILMASFLSRRLRWLITGINQFRRGYRTFRFTADIRDEFGLLAKAFDEMADNIVQSARTPYVITDLDLNIIYANERCLEVTGDEKLEDIVGRSYKDKSIYRFGSECCPVTALHQGQKRGKVVYAERTGKYFYGTANYFFDERGEKRGYIISSTDVTELSQKQLELEQAVSEMQRANQHKSRFLARMSHELRTPMNAMLGLNDLMQSQLGYIADLEGQRELSEYLTQLRSSSLRLLNLLNDVLETSDMEGGHVELVNGPLDLPIMFEAISVKIEAECCAKNVSFYTYFDDAIPVKFFADGMRLQRVLLNLLNNAVRQTSKGGRIDFVAQMTEQKGDQAKIFFAVRHCEANSRIGRGISTPQELKLGDDSYGNGLGLMVVQKILELFNSHINIRSDGGTELSFEVWLQEEEHEERAAVIPFGKCFVGQKTLVVDDVRINRIVLVNLLREFGFVVDEAEDGKEAFEKFLKSPENTYSIVFMDIQMPIMDGWEATITIRNLPRRDAKTIPIVAISANAFQEDIEKSQASGLNAHYPKPVQKEMLSEILNNFAGGKTGNQRV
ncbi:MAG: response regulator [Planctomycetaceae bacterium]|nr:response regulator [Planctomycetaceae bacterium]